MSESNLKFGTGITVWCILCIVAGVLSAASNLFSGLIPLVIVGVANTGAYLWLLLKKQKLAFYSIIGLVVVVLVINVVVYKLSVVMSLLGLLNPLITFAFLSKYWSQMD